MVNRATIWDVANRVGCSINTVSRALNNKPEISPATKAKILKAAAELGYRPNRLARGLRSQKSGVLGVVVADIGNPYFAAVVKGVVKAAQTCDYGIILQSSDENYAREKEAIQILLSHAVDGLLIVPTQKGVDSIVELQDKGVPFVLMSRYFENLQTDYVVMDDFKGGYLATKHLVELGHKKIAMINGPLHISSAKERFAGYVKALSENDLAVDTSLISHGALTIEDGYRVAAKMLQRSRPTAIFAFSDFVAFGVLRAIRETGLKVPGDVAVVGFDDILFSACPETSLTTISGSMRQLGSKAAEVLIRKLSGASCDKVVQIRLPVRLVVRNSTLCNAER